MRKNVFLKAVTCICAFYGVILSILTARREGYTPPFSRLYFTAQSNLLLGCSKLIEGIVLLCKQRLGRGLFVLSFISTVAVSLTGITFCFFLAPFSPGDYSPWTTCNLFTHVFTPLLGAVDFFANSPAFHLSKKTVWLCLIPPLVYALGISLLVQKGVNFGRGEPYPYFFFHYRSPAKIWGFSHISPFYVGSGYYLLALGIFTLALALVFRALYNKKSAKT